MKKAKDKWIEIIAKLTELTQDNILKWRISEVPYALKGFADVRIDAVYSSIYKGNHLRIYEKKKKETIMVNSSFETLWETSTVLDLVKSTMVDSDGISQWAFPPDPAFL